MTHRLIQRLLTLAEKVCPDGTTELSPLSNDTELVVTVLSGVIGSSEVDLQQLLTGSDQTVRS